MGTEELTFLLLGIIILVFLIDILIKKRKKSKDTEIEKIEINEKVKKGFWKNFFIKLVKSGFWKNFFEKQIKIFYWVYLGYILFVIFCFIIYEDYYKEFLIYSDKFLLPLTIIITVNILFYLIKILMKNDGSLKKIKTFLLATLFLFFSFISIKSITQKWGDFYELLLLDTFYWKTIYLEDGRWKPDCKKNKDYTKYKHTLELKYVDGTVFYIVKIVSNSYKKGTEFMNGDYINNINDLNCAPQKRYSREFALEDEDGFSITSFKADEFNTESGKIPNLDIRVPWKSVIHKPTYWRNQNGRYYVSKGQFYLSKEKFKKIKGLDLIKIY